MEFDKNKARALIKHSGYKQKYLAGKLGLSPASLNTYLSGKAVPPQEVIAMLAGLLHIQRENLLSGSRAS